MRHLIPAFPLVAPLLLSASLLAQTPVGGPILGDTTWTLASSPYDVVTPIIVGNDAVLTIEAGVVVRLEGGKTITVGSPAFGGATLIARGTASQPIRFTSGTAARGDWHTLLFSDEAVDATLVSGAYVSGSILEHCIVEYAGGGSASGAISIVHCAPFLVGCTIQLNDAPGVHANLLDGPTTPTPAMRIENCIAQQNGGTGPAGGIYLSGGSGHLVTGSTISGNTRAWGISILADGSAIRDSTIIGNVGSGGVHVSGDNMAVADCRIEGNWGTNGGGILVGTRGVYTIGRNLIVHNTAAGGGGGIYVSDNFFSQTVSILNNTIANNTANWGGGIWISRGGRPGPSTNVLTGNSIVHNTSNSGGGGIYLKSSPMHASGNTISCNHTNGEGGGLWSSGQPFLGTNTFACNTAGVSGGGLHVTRPMGNLKGDPASNVFNTLLGNTAPKGDAIYNAMRYATSGTGDIDASFVCWGPNNPNLVANRIWDYFDDPTLGIVVATNLVACDPFADLGAGVAGAAGTPKLAGAGPMTRRSTLDITLTDAAPQSPAALLIDAVGTFAYLPFLEAVVIPLTTPTFVPLFTDAAGTASIHVASLRGRTPAGVSLYFQALVLDPTASNTLFSFSNGLLAITQ